jgi:hypothetical protein
VSLPVLASPRNRKYPPPEANHSSCRAQSACKPVVQKISIAKAFQACISLCVMYIVSLPCPALPSRALQYLEVKAGSRAGRVWASGPGGYSLLEAVSMSSIRLYVQEVVAEVREVCQGKSDIEVWCYVSW